jgi:hypothetical protein
MFIKRKDITMRYYLSILSNGNSISICDEKGYESIDILIFLQKKLARVVWKFVLNIGTMTKLFMPNSFSLVTKYLCNFSPRNARNVRNI